MITNTLTALVESVYAAWTRAGLSALFPDGLWFQRAPEPDLILAGEPPASHWLPYIVFDVTQKSRKQYNSRYTAIGQYEVSVTAYLGEGIAHARVLMDALNSAFSVGLAQSPADRTYQVLSVAEIEPGFIKVDKDLKLGKDVLVGKLSWLVLATEQRELILVG